MTRTLIDRAYQLASLTGAFRPEDIASQLDLQPGDLALRQEVWGALGRDASEYIHEGVYYWILGPDRRRSALLNLYSKNQIDRIMVRLPVARPDDAFGGALRAILRRDRLQFPSPNAEASPAELADAIQRTAAILDATQFAEAAPALKGERLEVRRSDDDASEWMILAEIKEFAEAKIKSIQGLRDVAVVLPHKHYGYSGVRTRLSRHIRGLGEDPRPVLITGIGGVGKSALISRLLSGWTHRDKNLITILLDFDRRQLNAGEPVEIMQEFMRQLIAGLSLRQTLAAEAKEPVIKGLHEMRSELALWKRSLTGTRESHTVQLSDILSTLRKLGSAWARPLFDQPIALVLDTFEAVDRMGGFFRQSAAMQGEPPPESVVADQIMELELRLREAGLAGLRTVVSGREEPLSEDQMDHWFSHRVRLEGLTEISGARLLQDEAVRLAEQANGADVLTDFEDCRTASRVLLGHPLALLVFARYASKSPDDIDNLIDDLEDQGGEFSTEFAQTFLYDRILGRIDDPMVKQLAHPGLVVRQFNEDIIRLVLAGPCLDRGTDDDNPLTEDEAAQLLRRLQNEYWLVEPGEGPFSLRHRPDLRRLMLGGLFAGPRKSDTGQVRIEKTKLRDRANAVCTAAAAYFENGPPVTESEALARWGALDPDMRNLEATYYLALVSAPPARLEPELAERLTLHLKSDLESLPLPWLARVKFALGEQLNESEMRILDDAEREEAQARSFESAMQVGLTSGGRSTRYRSSRPAGDASAADETGKVPAESRKTRPARRMGGARTPEVPDAQPGTAGTGKPVQIKELDRLIRAQWAAAEFDQIVSAAEYFDTLSQAPESYVEEFLKGFYDGIWAHPAYLSMVLAGALGPRHALVAKPNAQRSLHFWGEFEFAAFSAGHGRFEIAGLEFLVRYRGLGLPHDAVFDNRFWARDALKILFKQGDADDGDWQLAIPGMALAARSPVSSNGTPELFPVSLQEFDPVYKALDSQYPEISLAGIERIFRDDHFLARSALLGFMADPNAASQVGALTQILRGLNPELYDPTISVTQRHDEHQIQEIVERKTAQAPSWPRDLRFDDTQVYSHSHAPTVVQTIDRCGLLRGFLVELAEVDKTATDLVNVYDFISKAFFPGFVDRDDHMTKPKVVKRKRRGR